MTANNTWIPYNKSEFFFQSTKITELTLSVLNEFQDCFPFYDTAKMLAEDSTTGIQLRDYAQ